jgi:DNA modification methylase
MRWLVRLLAAKTEQVEGGAIILDKFAGSGTTGAAAAAEGLRFLGIEQNAASVEQARARIAAITGDVDAARESIAKAPAGSQLALL